MKKILALATAAAAMVAAAGVANAQDCVGGYRMMKDQIPVACGESPRSAGLYASAPTALPEEPLYTGSINTDSEVPPLPQQHYVFAKSREECQPGQYWMLELDSNDRPVAC